MRKASAVVVPSSTAAPISSLKYGKCHSCGDSTTPSSEMKKLDTIFPMMRSGASGWVGSVQRAGVVHRCREVRPQWPAEVIGVRQAPAKR